MSQTRINPVVRLLPSLGDLAFLMPLVFLFGRMEGAAALLAVGFATVFLPARSAVQAVWRFPLLGAAADRDVIA